MTSTLTGKVALVTGATRGLGRAIAEGLAREGAKVVVSSRKPEACAAVAAEITELTGAQTMALPLHVGRWDDIAPAVARLEAALAPLHILGTNAGIAPPAPDPPGLPAATHLGRTEGCSTRKN